MEKVMNLLFGDCADSISFTKVADNMVQINFNKTTFYGVFNDDFSSISFVTTPLKVTYDLVFLRVLCRHRKCKVWIKTEPHCGYSGPEIKDGQQVTVWVRANRETKDLNFEIVKVICGEFEKTLEELKEDCQAR